MKKLTPKQVEVLTKASSDPRTAEQIADAIDVNENTVHRWRKKFPNGQGNPGVKRTYTKNTSDPTQALLAKLVRIQLDTNPDYLAKCLALLDLKAIMQ